jgi:serine/threonine protein kinase
VPYCFLLADDRAIDLWAVGVSLFELFTGHVMFPGRTNNEMLRLMMAVKGKFSNKQVNAECLSCDLDVFIYAQTFFFQLDQDAPAPVRNFKYRTPF